MNRGNQKVSEPGRLQMAEFGLELYMLGTTVGHFKILEKIGSGGMGIVHKAQDLTLDRMVALKSLPPTASDDKEAVARLMQEARTASLLDHPNICTIHEVFQTEDGQVFIAMAYYEGETLFEMLQSGSLPEAQALKIAADIAQGLAKAHRHGVIHRDIKPGNIIVTTDGVVKILDFGVAKLASMGSWRPASVGTYGYMSPEQLRGDPVDQRTDLWAWGLVLYEMLTGETNLGGMKRRGLMRAISSDTPGLRGFLESAMPSGPVEVLTKALQKNPADRYSRMEEALLELQQFCVPEADLPITRRQSTVARAAPFIAVLPFRSLSTDPEDEYFGHGLTEDLTDALTRLEGLHVAPRSSALALKEPHGRAEAAARLRVGLVLEGSVRRSGHRLRINVQLVDLSEERVLWSDRFDRNMTDIFAIQEEIATNVASTLKVRLTGRASAHLVKQYTQNMRAYNLYLKGRYQWNRESPEALFKAVETLEQAAEADPGYVSPVCGLAECYLVMGARALFPPLEAWRRAREASHRALELDPTFADAHGCLGAVLAIHDFDWAAAEREFHHGLEMNPESAVTRHWYAISLLAAQARFEEAIAQSTRAIDCEPLSLIYNSSLAWIYYLARRLEQAAEQCAKTLEIDPHHPDSLWCLGATYRELGQTQEAAATLKRLEAVASSLPLVYGSFGHGYARTGNVAEAENMLQKVQEAGRRLYSSPVCEAWIYANLPGQQDAALDCLEKGYAERDFFIRFIRLSPALSRISNHPRVHALLHKMGLGEPATEAIEQAETVAIPSGPAGRPSDAGEN